MIHDGQGVEMALFQLTPNTVLYGRHFITFAAGHLLPFGHPSAGARLFIAESSAFPSPATFVQDYVLPGQPLLMKGVYKVAPAFALWDDEYFR